MIFCQAEQNPVLKCGRNSKNILFQKFFDAQRDKQEHAIIQPNAILQSFEAVENIASLLHAWRYQTQTK